MEQQDLFDVIRKELRDRGLRYKDLAEGLGISVPGVKQMFRRSDCSVQRLAQIAKVLNVRVQDLVGAAEERGVNRVKISKEAQEYLVAHPRAFYFYWRMVIVRDDLETVVNELDLNASTLEEYLGKLEEHGLLSRDSEDHRPSPHGELYQWADEGPLLEFLNRVWGAATIEEARKHASDEAKQSLDEAQHGVFSLNWLPLRPESAQELRIELEDIGSKYLRLSRLQHAAAKELGSLVQTRLLIALAPGGFDEPVLETNPRAPPK